MIIVLISFCIALTSITLMVLKYMIQITTRNTNNIIAIWMGRIAAFNIVTGMIGFIVGTINTPTAPLLIVDHFVTYTSPQVIVPPMKPAPTPPVTPESAWQHEQELLKAAK